MINVQMISMHARKNCRLDFGFTWDSSIAFIVVCCKRLAADGSIVDYKQYFSSSYLNIMKQVFT